MKQTVAKKIGLAASAAMLAVVLGGCAPSTSTSATEAQQANRAYMSQVNETMVELDESLGGFVDAVSRGDVVNMRTQADNAYKVLDKLAGIKAPDEMKGIRDNYVDGTTKLRTALDEYIDLFTKVSESDGLFDEETFNARVAEIQSHYDEGVAALQKGDEAAAGTTATESSSSQAVGPAAGATAQSSSADQPSGSSAESNAASSESSSAA